MEHCGIDSIGANTFLCNGLLHNDFTRLMEALDNSQKALSSITNKNIEFILTDKIFYIKDNGIGMKDIDSNLKLFKISEDNTYSLSKCGMGLNSLLTSELYKKNNNNNFGYIISSYIEENEIKLTGRKINFNKELNKEPIDFSQPERDESYKLLNNETGTIIIIDKEKKKEN